MTVTNTLNINDDGLQDFDSTTGDFSAIALDTKGDLLAFDGTNYQKFPVGTDGYVLKADSAESVGFRWACVNSEFISSQTASSSSTIDFTGFADSECFSGYKLVWKNVRMTGGTRNLNLRFSVNNGSTWLSAGYKYTRDSIRDDTADEVFPSDDSASEIQINGHTGDSSNISMNGEGFFYPSATPLAGLKQGFVYSSSNVSGNAQFLRSNGWGINITLSQVNGFRFLLNSGTITSGEFYLYGVLEE